MNTEPKTVGSRDTLDLLELVCQLHSRALNQPRNKDMHDAYVEARQEMERRIKVNNNFVLADVISSVCDHPLNSLDIDKKMLHHFCNKCKRYAYKQTDL